MVYNNHLVSLFGQIKVFSSISVNSILTLTDLVHMVQFCLYWRYSHKDTHKSQQFLSVHTLFHKLEVVRSILSLLFYISFTMSFNPDNEFMITLKVVSTIQTIRWYLSVQFNTFAILQFLICNLYHCSNILLKINSIQRYQKLNLVSFIYHF